MKLEEAKEYLRNLIKNENITDEVKALSYFYGVEAIATILQELENLSGIEALIKVFPVDSMPENTRFILITKENFLNNPNYQQLLKDYISKDKIREKIEEINEEYQKRSKDNDSFYFDYGNEYAHIEEVLQDLLREE